MTYNILEPSALDYFPCRYGTSKLVFRGPARNLVSPYVAFIGGTQTYGKFIEQPYPLKVEHLTGVRSVNFGQVNAGLDVFLKEDFVLEVARGARVTVLEVLGAANLSSRLYTVHTRRNDRFLHPSAELHKLYPETDFTQFNFTGHMLSYLYDQDQERFGIVRDILQRVWKRRMRKLLEQIGPRVVLLRFATEGADQNSPSGRHGGPLLVTDAMLDSLRGSVCAVVDLVVPTDIDDAARTGMVFGPFEEEAARAVAPPELHTQAAEALRPMLDHLM